MAKNQNQANDYRAERKKRLANNAKRKTKIVIDSTAILSGIISTVLIVAALIFSLVITNNLFQISYKVLPAVKVDGETYSAAEYSFYYTSVFNTYAEQSSSLYSSLGYYSFDYTKDPAAQTTTDADGNTITYHELFKQKTLENIETTHYYLEKCAAEGYTLDEEHENEVTELLDEFAEYAKSNNVSLTKYVSVVYGKGLTAKSFAKLIRDQYLVAQYLEKVEEGYYAEITDEQLEEAYAKDPSAYQSVDLRLFGFKVPASEDKDAEVDTSETEALAKQMLARITNEASFIDLAYEYAEKEDKDTFKQDAATLAKSIKKSVVVSNIGEDVAEWLYSEERAAGDKATFTSKNKDYVYVLYMLNPCYRNEEPLVDARHVLISFDSVIETLKANKDNKIDIEKNADVEIKTIETEDGTTITNEGTSYSIELVEETYKLAKEVYDKYMSGSKTEASFAVLAEKYSGDTSSLASSKSTSTSAVEYTEETISTTTENVGGLYMDIERGEMVAPFENWIYDASREVGDVELVMTTYGWHVIYFSGRDTEAAWKLAVRSNLSAEAYEEYSNSKLEEIKGTAVEAKFYDYATKKVLEAIDERY